VGSRERKRAERRKRKARSAESSPSTEPHEDEAIAASAAAAGSAEQETEGAVARGYARADQRNREAREKLEPLEQGERPGAVTVGAIISAVIALIFWVSTAVAAAGSTTVSGRHPNPVQLGLVAVIVSVMAVGMWRSRYWAVLGFQTLLVLLLLAAAAGLVTAITVWQVIGTLLLMAGAGALFYFMIRAMARIQMPGR
jgi:hypothetical protein